MILAVPGMLVCIAKRRCNVVDVKKPNIIIKFSVEALFEKYVLSASKCLFIHRRFLKKMIQ